MCTHWESFPFCEIVKRSLSVKDSEVRVVGMELMVVEIDFVVAGNGDGIGPRADEDMSRVERSGTGGV